MYHKYRIVESIASNVSHYESDPDQVYRYPAISYMHGTGIWEVKIFG